MHMKKNYLIFRCVFFCAVTLVMFSCTESQQTTTAEGSGLTWAEKLGFAKNKKVIILHADDAGMCDEANQAVFAYLGQNHIQSTAAMVPCKFFDEFAAWAAANPEKDTGIHLTLTSEWNTYRWGPVSDPAKVPGLIDPDGFLWHEVPQVVTHASAAEIEIEIRAQIEKAVSLGMKVDHIDTHMGTMFGRLDYTQVYLKVAQAYNVPAMVINLADDEVFERFRKEGYPLNKDTRALLAGYPMPQLDDFYAVPAASTYEEKINSFTGLVKSLKPGLTEIIFHPSVETENLKSITNSWQQRVWEARMFSDPQLIRFLQDEQVIFTNWIEIMERFKG
jgi:chitin disaccharide deacetylase